MNDLLGVTIATATIVRISQDAADRLQGFAETVRDQVAAALVKHLDETGFRPGGKTQWLPIACTLLLTFYRVCVRRGTMLAAVTRTIVDDHWKPCYTTPNMTDALCKLSTCTTCRRWSRSRKKSWRARCSVFSGAPATP